MHAVRRILSLKWRAVRDMSLAGTPEADELPSLDAADGNINPDDLRISVTSTTMMLQILHDRMSAQGWGSLPAVQVPLAPQPTEPLPERPANVGEGLWR